MTLVDVIYRRGRCVEKLAVMKRRGTRLAFPHAEWRTDEQARHLVRSARHRRLRELPGADRAPGQLDGGGASSARGRRRAHSSSGAATETRARRGRTGEGLDGR